MTMTLQETEVERRDSQLVDVDFPKRLIELIVMPYESPTTINHHGKTITEIVSRGAYDGVEKRAGQIKVNRGHVIDNVVGKTVALHPSRMEGLVAEIRISRTDLGEDTLVLANDGILDASAGFVLMRENGKVKPDAEVWENRDTRRLNHLFLHHIAMTPDPAYQDARVLAVRKAEGQAPAGDETGRATPNRDRMELERYKALAADLDRRYGLAR
jgi:HK97 family phage prohead protease